VPWYISADERYNGLMVELVYYTYPT